MSDWDSIARLCNYLEEAAKELDDKVHSTQSDVMKLQDILDAISPVPVSEPREEVRAPRQQQNRKVFRGFDHKVTPQAAAASANPFGDFLMYLDQYKQASKFDRSHLGDRFSKRVMDFSRTTAAHLHLRLIPCVERLARELNRVLDYDLSQPNLRLRAKYTTDKATNLMQEFEKTIREFGLTRRTDVFAHEQVDEPLLAKPKRVESGDQLETLANFTPKQLNALYAMRGAARRNLMAATIKEKAEAHFVPFLKGCSFNDDETEQVNVLHAAQRAFMILSHDPRSYALVVGS
jgi:hypothetical protein